ncbi:MAG: ribonuclease HII [Pseudomonadota bacterium]
MTGPTLQFETACGAPVVAGVDEVGRGPWAGPVVAAAVILDTARLPDGLNDSKKLSRQRRETLDVAIRQTSAVGLGVVDVADIDRLNILAAAMEAMRRAVAALPVAPGHALIDGNRLPDLAMPATAVVKGDGLSVSIAAASIVAKVHRDRLMANLAETFPAYGWERNAGYGTAEHQAALRDHGVTCHHRRSFAPIARLLAETG